MDISIPVTIQYPSVTTTTPGPFGGQNVQPAVQVNATAVLHVDATIQAEIASLLIAPSPETHLSATALAAQYTQAELLAALSAGLVK